MRRFKKLEEYGIIGNLETCALVGLDGSIDWFCMPHMDSPSIFAGILDAENGGHFYIRPSGSYDSHQEYAENTNILNTIFDTQSGSIIVTDFMPVDGNEDNSSADGNKDDSSSDAQRAILRRVKCTRGSVKVEIDFRPRFNYGRDDARLSATDDIIIAAAADQKFFLKSSAPLEISKVRAQCTRVLKAGETHWIVLRYGKTAPGDEKANESLLEKTNRYWTDWLSTSELRRPILQGPWHDVVIRSALVLKLLTNAKTGAVIAAPTTSLPESIGGIRNWDYRYCWLRDSAFTIQAFETIGYYREALDYFQWLKNVSYTDVKTGGPPNLKIAYTFKGKDVPPERVLDYLTGYMNSAPVRVGNAARGQLQLDIYGEIVNSFYQARGYEKDLISTYWKFLHALADHVCKSWRMKDSGIWELRSEPRHLTHSKLMCWVALDRIVRLANQYRLDGAVAKWSTERDAIRNAILDKGFSRRLNSFVQAFDYEALDSTSLLIPVMGLLPADDPRVEGTIEAVSKGLASGEFLHRYEGDDGLPGEEGAFLLCSFWLVRTLALAGQVERAQSKFMKILEYKNPLGLFSEEIDPRSGLQIGNFPQAFSHLGLINAAMYLGKRQGREGAGPNLIGSDQ